MKLDLTARWARRSIAIVLVMLVLIGAALWALPEIVRRVAVDQATTTLGRTVTIDDVDLNLFTGRVAVKKLRVAERQGPEAFVAFDRLDVHLAYWPLVRSNVRIYDVRLDGLAVRAARTGAAEFSFSDVVERLSKPAPEKPPSKLTYTVDRLALTRASIAAVDEHVSPRAEWRLDGIGVEAANITTARGQPPGTLRVNATLNGESALAVEAASIGIEPLAASVAVSLTDFDLARVRPYVPPETPASLRSGKLGANLKMAVERSGDALRKASASGEIRLGGVSVVQRDRPDPFLTVGQVALAIKEADLVSRTATVSVDLDRVDVKALRDKAGEIDLMLLAAKPPDAAAKESTPTTSAAPSPAEREPTPADAAKPFVVTLERLGLREGSVALRDEAVAPPRDWRIDGLTVDASGLSTGGNAPPGKLSVRAQITSSPGGKKPASLAVDSDSLRLVPLAASVKLALSDFDVTTAMPYVPGTLPASPSKGRLGVDVTARVERGDADLTRAAASGTVRLDDVAVVQRGAKAPFVSLPKLVVAIKDADAVARAITIGRIELEGLDVRAVRDAKGRIDLLDLLAAPEQALEPRLETLPRAPRSTAAAPKAPSGPAKPAQQAGKEWRLALDRFVLAKGKATFEDRAVSPNTSLVLGDLSINAERLSWPPTSKAALVLSVNMPGGGRTEIKGGGTLEPLDIQIATTTLDAPIDPYRPYFPFVAEIAGLFSGDSVSEIQRGPDGTLILASRGNAWARKISVKGPDDPQPAIRTTELEIGGIDFSWPNYALVDRVKLTHPEVQIERADDGEINLRRLFAPRPPKPDDAPAEKPAEEKAAEEKTAEDKPDGDKAEKPGLMQTMVIDFREIRIDDGYLRFLDRTTEPDFSEDISKLTLSVRDLSNVLGRQRTTMSLQAMVGGDAALDMRGETSGIGEAFQADLVGELRDFALSSANPYADNLTSWIVQRGKLTAKVHYRVEGDRLSADHDVKFAGLNVQRAREADAAKSKLGVPLGLAVALLKDSRGDIDFDLPLKGTLSDKKFDWGEAMWSAAKQVLVKVLAAPFNAIGRMFTGGGDKVEELEINPVTFEPGSSVIAPSAELQITRVADFLRRSPYVKVDLSAVATKADGESIRSREVLARVQQFQKERGAADMPAALTAYFQETLPGVALPETTEAQLGMLSQREPPPPSLLAELTARRLEGVKDRLVKTEGIPAERVASGKASPPDRQADGEGRVEFAIAAE